LLEPALGSPVADERGQVANDETGRVDFRRLEIVGVRADVTDVRIRQRDDLPEVRRVRQDLLIARHGGVENDLAERAAFGTDRDALEHRAIFER
jgi:hypothetical protein